MSQEEKDCFKVQLTKKISKSPAIKTGIFIISVILSGVLCSAFITEITLENELHWSMFYTKITFWLIILYCIIVYLYNRFVYKLETDILNFLDDNYCLAYMRKECLPELVEKYKEDVRLGKKSKELIDIKKELEKFSGK